MHRTPRRWILLALDIVLILMEIYALAVSWEESGIKLFRYYTQDSNVLALIACCICLVQNVLCLCRGCRMPGWTRKLRYYAACCLMVTLLVAGCLLAPLDPKRSFVGFMLEGKYLYLHTLCPLLMLATLYVHPGPRLREKHALKSLIPTLIYGAVLLTLNAKGVFSGPYPFLKVRDQEAYVTITGCISVLAVNYFVSRLMAALSRGEKRQRNGSAG